VGAARRTLARELWPEWAPEAISSLRAYQGALPKRVLAPLVSTAHAGSWAEDCAKTDTMPPLDLAETNSALCRAGARSAIVEALDSDWNVASGGRCAAVPDEFRVWTRRRRDITSPERGGGGGGGGGGGCVRLNWNTIRAVVSTVACSENRLERVCQRRRSDSTVASLND